MRFLPWLSSGLVLFVCTAAWADVSDPAGARAQLQVGYDLKKQGKCDQALPYFIESLRLNRDTKALLNLADCEEKLGKLASAQAHFVEARDLATAQGLAPQRTLAEERIQALEKRMPHLLVRLAKGAPSDTEVRRDGVQLGGPSLNAPLPVDPGKHVVLVRRGNLEKQYDVTLTESETREIEVTPEGGHPVETGSNPEGSPPPSGAPMSTPRSSMGSGEPTDSVTARSSFGGRRGLELALLGVGVAGLAFGTVEALRVSSKNNEMLARCPDENCPTQVAYTDTRPLREDAISARTMSMIGFGTGSVALVTVAVLFFSDAPSSKSPASGLAVRPEVRVGATGITLQGTW